MKAKIALALILAAAVVAVTLAILRPPSQLTVSEPQPQDATSAPVSSEAAPPETSRPVATARAVVPPAPPTQPPVRGAPTASPVTATNKLERLLQVREEFRGLAAGDRKVAINLAGKITDPNQRETALLTLVTEWTHGELRSPAQRAEAIDAYGLEAGLGMELVKDPDLALLWANELTSSSGPGSSGRTALMAATASAMVSSDPAGAFALSEQIPQTERRRFMDAVFADWAGKDTEAALQWADKAADPAERDAALVAIRSVAPVGIGAALGVEDGYPVIRQLIPGTPSELSGQLHAGDRIVALAQGDNSFVDAHSLTLKAVVDMVRGAPGTVVQLQVLAADAPPNSLPRTVSITRDQIKHKQ